MRRLPWTIHDYWGYDAEYELTITVGRSQIRWDLEMDKQWSDPPQSETQTHAQFLRAGPPSFCWGANSTYLDQIREICRALEPQTSQHPHDASRDCESD